MYIKSTRACGPCARPVHPGTPGAAPGRGGDGAVRDPRAHRVCLCTVAVHCTDSRLQPIARARRVVVRGGEGLEGLLGLRLAPEGQVRPLPPVGVELGFGRGVGFRLGLGSGSGSGSGSGPGSGWLGFGSGSGFGFGLGQG